MSARIFEEKSNQSYSAAKLLSRKGMHCSAVNRYYYCIYCLMLHFLIDKAGYTEEDIKQKSPVQGGSHIFVSNEIKRSIIAGKKIKRRDFDRHYFKLKSQRIDADYSSINFNRNNSIACKTHVSELKKILTNHFL